MDQWLQTVPAWIYDLPSGLRTLLYQLYQTFIACGMMMSHMVWP